MADQQASRPDITAWILQWSGGDKAALDKLTPFIYGELRLLASRFFRSEHAGQTLQATALVHEAYMRLVEDDRLAWQNRAHFFGIAARCMRQILVDHARSRNAVKRGGDWQQVPLDEF